MAKVDGDGDGQGRPVGGDGYGKLQIKLEQVTSANGYFGRLSVLTVMNQMYYCIS